MSYVPDRGDLVALIFDPQAGHEQKGRRPALVISKRAFHQRSKLAFVVPITNTDRRIPLHVPIPEACSVTGFLMVDQTRSLDFRARRARRIEKLPEPTLDEVLSIIDAILF